ncbi:cold-shock protein [Rhodococcoides kyotonense]|uniref:Cold shock protein, CspA family n=1 Tax=Rhodococcoides kyotonense TaxID=398843 RepID=A0A239MVZ0_9NOCA|nr:cold shock domain-containing protein [Rhodococcus kyotonensis]SNT46403.1 Cold shock protein, CspA family [Rhodococcus kyotonensis]
MLSTGKVVRFDEFKGYGFVAPDSGGEDVFIHVNDLTFDKRLLAPGVRVEYVAEEGDRGPKAGRVRIVDAPKPVTRAAVPAVVPAAETHYDDVVCDVLTLPEFTAELTEGLLRAHPGLTAEQVLDVRDTVTRIARVHRWVED